MPRQIPCLLFATVCVFLQACTSPPPSMSESEAAKYKCTKYETCDAKTVFPNIELNLPPVGASCSVGKSFGETSTYNANLGIKYPLIPEDQAVWVALLISPYSSRPVRGAVVGSSDPRFEDAAYRMIMLRDFTPTQCAEKLYDTYIIAPVVFSCDFCKK